MNRALLTQHMKMLGFKFEQTRTISEEFDYFMGVGHGVQILKFYSQLLFIGKHMKMYRFKFQQNGTIDEGFDF